MSVTYTSILLLATNRASDQEKLRAFIAPLSMFAYRGYERPFESSKEQYMEKRRRERQLLAHCGYPSNPGRCKPQLDQTWFMHEKTLCNSAAAEVVLRYLSLRLKWATGSKCIATLGSPPDRVVGGMDGQHLSLTFSESKDGHQVHSS